MSEVIVEVYGEIDDRSSFKDKIAVVLDHADTATQARARGDKALQINDPKAIELGKTYLSRLHEAGLIKNFKIPKRPWGDDDHFYATLGRACHIDLEFEHNKVSLYVQTNEYWHEELETIYLSILQQAGGKNCVTGSDSDEWEDDEDLLDAEYDNY